MVKQDSRLSTLATGATVIALVAAIAGAQPALHSVREYLSAEAAKTHPTLFLAGGMAMDLGDGRHALAYGRDRCPAPEGLMADLFGASQARSDCIRLGDDQAYVDVLLATDEGKDVSERWAVRTASGRTYLTRPNGAFVSPFDAR